MADVPPPQQEELPGADPQRNLDLWFRNVEYDPVFQKLSFDEKRKKREAYFTEYVQPYAKDPNVEQTLRARLLPTKLESFGRATGRAAMGGGEPAPIAAPFTSYKTGVLPPGGLETPEEYQRRIEISNQENLTQRPGPQFFGQLAGAMLPLALGGLSAKIAIPAAGRLANLGRAAITMATPAAMRGPQTGETLPSRALDVGSSALAGALGFGLPGGPLVGAGASGLAAGGIAALEGRPKPGLVGLQDAAQVLAFRSLGPIARKVIKFSQVQTRDAQLVPQARPSVNLLTPKQETTLAKERFVTGKMQDLVKTSPSWQLAQRLNLERTRLTGEEVIQDLKLDATLNNPTEGEKAALEHDRQKYISMTLGHLNRETVTLTKQLRIMNQEPRAMAVESAADTIRKSIQGGSESELQSGLATWNNLARSSREFTRDMPPELVFGQRLRIVPAPAGLNRLVDATVPMDETLQKTMKVLQTVPITTDVLTWNNLDPIARAQHIAETLKRQLGTSEFAKVFRTATTERIAERLSPFVSQGFFNVHPVSTAEIATVSRISPAKVQGLVKEHTREAPHMPGGRTVIEKRAGGELVEALEMIENAKGLDPGTKSEIRRKILSQIGTSKAPPYRGQTIADAEAQAKRGIQPVGIYESIPALGEPPKRATRMIKVYDPLTGEKTRELAPDNGLEVTQLKPNSTAPDITFSPEQKAAREELRGRVLDNTSPGTMQTMLMNYVTNVYDSQLRASKFSLTGASLGDLVGTLDRKLVQYMQDNLRHVPFGAPTARNPIRTYLDLLDTLQAKGYQGKIESGHIGENVEGALIRRNIPNTTEPYKYMTADEIDKLPQSGDHTKSGAVILRVPNAESDTVANTNWYVTRTEDGKYQLSAADAVGRRGKRVPISSRDLNDMLYANNGFSLESIRADGGIDVIDLETGEHKSLDPEQARRASIIPNNEPDLSGIEVPTDPSSVDSRRARNAPTDPIIKPEYQSKADMEYTPLSEEAQRRLQARRAGKVGMFYPGPMPEALETVVTAAGEKIAKGVQNVGTVLREAAPPQSITPQKSVFLSKHYYELGLKYGFNLSDPWFIARRAEVNMCNWRPKAAARVNRLMQALKTKNTSSLLDYVTERDPYARATIREQAGLTRSELDLVPAIEEHFRDIWGAYWTDMLQDIKSAPAGEISPALRTWHERGGLHMYPKDLLDLIPNSFASKQRFLMDHAVDPFRQVAARISKLPEEATPQMSEQELQTIMPHATKALLLKSIFYHVNKMEASVNFDHAAAKSFMEKFAATSGLDLPANFADKILPKYLLLSYASTMPFRIGLVLRNLTQPLTTTLLYSGFENFREGMKRYMSKEGQALVKELGFHEFEHITMEHLVESEGKLYGKINKVYNLGMRPFNWSDTVTRGISANIGWSSIERFAPRFLSGEISDVTFMRKTGLIYLEKGVQDHVLQPLADTKMPREMRIQESAKRMAVNMSEDTNWLYHQGNSPQIFGSRWGKFLGQFGTWPTSYLRFLNNGLRSGDPVATAGFMARWFLVNAGIKEAGEHIFGIDPTSWLFLGPISYLGGPGAELVKNVYEAVSGPDFQRQRAGKALLRSLPTFIPFYSAVRDVIRFSQETEPKTAVKRLMGFRPYEQK